MQLLDPTQPWWLPKGSLRALFAGLLLLAFIAACFVNPPQFNAIAGAALTVVAYYFGHRGAKPDSTGKAQE